MSETVWSMAGTERSYEYLVVAANGIGRIGVRRLDGMVRVRIEAATLDDVQQLATVFAAPVWKQPSSGQPLRFSQVVSTTPEGVKTVEWAIRQLDKLDTSGHPLKRNPLGRRWRAKLA